MRIGWSLAACLAAVTGLPAQDAATPDELIRRLESGPRTAARAALLAMGKAAVPALTARLAGAERDLAHELPAILEGIGPDAGGAVPELMAGIRSRADDAMGPWLAALAELGPYRPSGCEVDWTAIHAAVHRERTRSRMYGGEGAAPTVLSRLEARLGFPRPAEVEDLLQVASGSHAFRVELAIEQLGRHGAAALPALPLLLRLLERPEPRILTTTETVPIRRKAAQAILAIAPDCPEAWLAREVLAGSHPVVPAAAEVPERMRARLAELRAELDEPDKRSAAAANLVALGSISVPVVAAAIRAQRDADAIATLLATLRELGPIAAPHLADLLFELPVEHSVAVIEALTVAAPASRDLLPCFEVEASPQGVAVLGRSIDGKPDIALLNRFGPAWVRLVVAVTVRPDSSVVELRALLADRLVLMREAPLRVVRERRDAARPLLPQLRDMLAAEQPKLPVMEWLDGGEIRTMLASRDEEVQRLAAEAILVVAAADDPLVPAARAVLHERK